jgi:hypothetical protein
MHLSVLRRRRERASNKEAVCKECRSFKFGVDELASKLETTFSMVSCLSTNTISGVGWYVDSGASKHMTFNKKAFNKLQEQEDGIQVELGNDATYLVTKMGFVSFYMPLGDVLELDDVLYVLGLTKNLLSVSAMTDLRCVVEFDDQQVIIRDCSHEHGQVLAKGV